MTKIDFHRLVNRARPFAREGSTKVRHDSLSLEKRLAITLYYLKDQGSMKMTANSFGVAKCTVRRVKEEIGILISENIGPSFFFSPSQKNDFFECNYLLLTVIWISSSNWLC